MNYVPHLIANFATGFDVERQPWLNPDDSQSELLDGYIYLGVWQKREGYSQLATGLRGGSAYTESRMVHNTGPIFFSNGNGTTGPYVGFARNVFAFPLLEGDGTVGPYNAVLGTISQGSLFLRDAVGNQNLIDNGAGAFIGDGTGTIDYVTGAITFTFTIAVGVGNTITANYNNRPIQRGSVTIANGDTNQSVTDDGLGSFTGDGNGTIDYLSGAISINFNAPASGLITSTFNWFPGLPVMGVMNFYTQQNIRELIVADTKYINRYNTTTNRLEDISPPTAFTGDETNFFSWTNYPDPNGNQRLLFVNNKDQIHQYMGSSITPYPVYTATTQITSVASGVVGDGTAGPYIINTPASTGISPGSLSINEPNSAQTVTDNQFGSLQGQGFGSVDYLNGAISVTFNAAIGVGDAINLTYLQLNVPIQTCLHIKQFKDRLIALSIIENNGTIRGLRILISGTGSQGDIFTPDATGAGFIDIPDQDFIDSCDFNRDDLLIFTLSSPWILKPTGSDVVPFTLAKMDESRGSQARFGTITYLNRTSATSPRGFIITDGYSVERSDGKIPRFSFNEINQARFNLCFAGSVDEDRDHYLLYPTQSANPSQVSDRILVTNYEEDNQCIYRIPLSCMGNYIESSNTTWDDLSIYDNWDQMAAVYGTWNNFAYSKGTPISVGGGHEGQIFKLNLDESEDYPVKIRNMTVIDSQTLRIETDFQNYQIGDIINIEGCTGMVQANSKQAAISSISTLNYVFDLAIPTAGFSAYSDGGTASKVIIFSSKTKKFNPFANQNQKVRCGWVYFYISHTGTNLTDNKVIIGASNAETCVLHVPGHGYTTGTEVYVDGVQGMTELNGMNYQIVVIDHDFIALVGVNSTGFGVYAGSGFTSIPADAKMQVRVIVNDTEQSTVLNGFNPAPYEINLSNAYASNGIKKWYKLFINQVGRFIQFEFISAQAGANVQIHAIMPGFSGIGRLI